MCDLIGEESVGGVPPTQWFNANDGIKTVHVLIAAVSKSPKAVERAEQVIEDLESLEEALRVAERAKIKFRLTMDF
jgi:hypothetical protein